MDRRDLLKIGAQAVAIGASVSIPAGTILAADKASPVKSDPRYLGGLKGLYGG